LSRRLRIAIVYDRVFPASYGGAERWFRLLAESLAAEGHQVAYLTTEHWSGGTPPDMRDVEIIPLTTASEIYGDARRRIGPVLGFGAAVAKYMHRHGKSFDVVHSSAMAPGAAHAVVSLASRVGYCPVLDWWEVWEKAGWRAYLGRASGEVAAQLEQRLARSPHLPVVYSRLHADRLTRLRGRDDALFITGVHPRALPVLEAAAAKPYILLANRLIPEKQTEAILPAMLLARETLPGLGAVVVGSGPMETELKASIARLGLGETVHLRRNVSDEELEKLMKDALCVALLSRREGYGLVVAEATRYGTPSLVLDHPDSAASERIAANENGLLLRSLDPQELASAILAAHAAGKPFRDRTLAWRKRHDGEMTVDSTLPTLVSHYQQCVGERRNAAWRSGRP
jgi:glycosyltransferase involved in cell wall biosynthesis